MSEAGEGKGSPSLALDSRPSLASVLGPEAIRHLGAAAKPELQGEWSEDAKAEVFSQVRQVVEALQEELRDSELLLAELQEKADGWEEKHTLLLRRVRRAERDRDLAVQRSAEVEVAVRQLREEAAPVIARFMESEVLRSQLQACSEDLVRLKEEMAACKEELAEGLPKLAELEDDEAECAGALAQLEAQHTEEVSLLTTLHKQEVEELRCQHALKVAELERARREQVDELKRSNAEESDQLRSALESARWQADVYVREHQEAVREICLRQRENARLAKKHSESRQEALELAVRLEALKAAEAGAPARQAELQAVRHRYNLLLQTAAEWREALIRKQGDCDLWRRRSESKGLAVRRDDAELQAEIQSLVAAPAFSPPRLGYWGEAFGGDRPTTQTSHIGQDDSRSAASWTGWMRTPNRRTAPLQSPLWRRPARRGRSLESTRLGLPVSGQPRLDVTPRSPSPHPAGEFVTVVLKAAKLREEAQTNHEGSDGSLQRAIVEAENEVEMLAFLLEEADSSEAEVLLEMEAQLQEPKGSLVAAQLRAQIAELQGRKQRSLSPPDREGHCDGDGEVSA